MPLIFLLTKRHEKWDEYKTCMVSQACKLLLLFVARFEVDHSNVELASVFIAAELKLVYMVVGKQKPVIPLHTPSLYAAYHSCSSSALELP